MRLLSAHEQRRKRAKIKRWAKREFHAQSEKRGVRDHTLPRL